LTFMWYGERLEGATFFRADLSGSRVDMLNFFRLSLA